MMESTRARKRAARKAKAKRRSVIEALPMDDDSFFETTIVAVLGLLKEEATGSIFVQRDGGAMYRVTVEKVLEARE